MKKEELNWLYKSMKHVPNGSIVVEIGSWVGASGSFLAKGIQRWSPRSLLHCVDPFDMDYINSKKGLTKKMRNLDKLPYDAFRERMKPYRYSLIRLKSEDAVKQFDDESVSFLFIDGNHDYEYVKKDILLWWSKMAPGSIMCGHDYTKPGVEEAVKECCSIFTLPVGTIWKSVKFQ